MPQSKVCKDLPRRGVGAAAAARDVVPRHTKGLVALGEVELRTWGLGQAACLRAAVVRAFVHEEARVGAQARREVPRGRAAYPPARRVCARKQRGRKSKAQPGWRSVVRVGSDEDGGRAVACHSRASGCRTACSPAKRARHACDARHRETPR
eukprot:scaffold80228_cov68-Phaeocystis_antarctica.AAC.1